MCLLRLCDDHRECVPTRPSGQGLYIEPDDTPTDDDRIEVDDDILRKRVAQDRVYCPIHVDNSCYVSAAMMVVAGSTCLRSDIELM